MLLDHKKVAIIGAGPVGLTMAKLLQQREADVTVYERDKNPQARIWGGTLDLHKGSGQDALQKAGLLEKYYAASIPMGVKITNEQGLLLSDVAPQYDNPEINRNDLRRLLLDSLQSNTVAWGSKVTGLEVRNGKWLLQCDGKAEATADLVIVANGGKSGVRSYVTDAEAEDTGTFIIQGDVPQPAVNCPAFYRWCDGKRLMTAHQGNLLVANPYNNGALTYGIIFRTPEAWTQGNAPDFQDKAAICSFLAARFAGWHPNYHLLFRATSFFAGLPARRLSLEQAWKKERPLPVTLIGDAAHVMPPFAGQGVNIGLVDALTLADNLTEGAFGTIEAAIEAYEQKMFIYARAAQADSGRNEIEMRQPDFSFQKRFAH